MTVSADFLQFTLDQFRSLGLVTHRRMFGGVGLYHDGLFFALIDDDQLYLKTDASSRDCFLMAGQRAFEPRPGQSMDYHSVPDYVLESPEQLAVWSRVALEAALRAGDSPRKASRVPRANSGVRTSRK